MPVRMVIVRHMRVRVPCGLVPVPVAVGGAGHRLVRVQVVPVVMGVGVLMRE